MQKERPLSPHLQIYKLQITMVLSILHRGTGIFLAFGAPVLVYWLWAIADGAQSYHDLQHCLSHWFAQLFMLGWTFSLFYHLCNGIRHLFWDIGKGFEINRFYTSGRVVVVSAFILTAITVYFALAHTGGAS